MKPKPEITIDEWLGELLAAQEQSADGFATVQEIAAACGHGVAWVREKLQHAKAGGRLQCAVVQRAALDSRACKVPAYKITRGGK